MSSPETVVHSSQLTLWHTSEVVLDAPARRVRVWAAPGYGPFAVSLTGVAGPSNTLYDDTMLFDETSQELVESISIYAPTENTTVYIEARA